MERLEHEVKAWVDRRTFLRTAVAVAGVAAASRLEGILAARATSMVHSA